jgi:hypothetical protein
MLVPPSWYSSMESVYSNASFTTCFVSSRGNSNWKFVMKIRPL